MKERREIGGLQIALTCRLVQQKLGGGESPSCILWEEVKLLKVHMNAERSWSVVGSLHLVGMIMASIPVSIANIQRACQ